MHNFFSWDRGLLAVSLLLWVPRRSSVGVTGRQLGCALTGEEHCTSHWFNILSFFRRFNARYISRCQRPVESKPGSSQRRLQGWHWERQEPEVDSRERGGHGRGQGGGSGGLCGSVCGLRLQRLQRYVGQGTGNGSWSDAAYSLSADSFKCCVVDIACPLYSETQAVEGVTW